MADILDRKNDYDYDSSEFDDYKQRYYEYLRDGRIRIRISRKLFECPFCRDRRGKEYDYKGIRSHAYRIGYDVNGERWKDRGRHLGLLCYLESDVHGLSTERRTGYDERSRSPTRDLQFKERPKYKNGSSPMYNRSAYHKTVEREASISAKDVVKPVERSSTELQICDEAKSNVSTNRPISRPNKSARSNETSNDELFVHPWVAVVANIFVDRKSCKYERATSMRDDWLKRGFNPVRVRLLWNYRGQSEYAIVEFNKDWIGFVDAMKFEKAFQAENHGRQDWHPLEPRGDSLYAWIAREDDYNSRGVVGEYLRKNGDLRTVKDIEAENKRKDKTLVTSLTNHLEGKTLKCEETKKELSKIEVSMGNVMKENEEMVHSHNQEMKMIREGTYNYLWDVWNSHEKSMLELEDKREKLKLREEELKQIQTVTENEKKRFDHEKKMNEMAIMEQKKVDEKMFILVEEQKKEKEKHHAKAIELEKQIDAKQALEREVEQLRGALGVMKHMNEDGDVEAKNKMDKVKEELKEKEEELEEAEELNRALSIKESISKKELEDAREELINGLVDTHSRSIICVKKLGELDMKTFMKVAKEKFSKAEAAEKAVELCSLWENYIRDPSWWPFKVDPVENKDEGVDVIDENDEKLKSLKEEYGGEVYEAVTTALTEMRTYNPHERRPVPQLWNSKEKRIATLTEGAAHLVRQLKLQKSKRRYIG